jgi:hypothetical protein
VQIALKPGTSLSVRRAAPEPDAKNRYPLFRAMLYPASA